MAKLPITRKMFGPRTLLPRKNKGIRWRWIRCSKESMRLIWWKHRSPASNWLWQVRLIVMVTKQMLMRQEMQRWFLSLSLRRPVLYLMAWPLTDSCAWIRPGNRRGLNLREQVWIRHISSRLRALRSRGVLLMASGCVAAQWKRKSWRLTDVHLTIIRIAKMQIIQIRCGSKV